jgi:hypothetical protein
LQKHLRRGRKQPGVESVFGLIVLVPAFDSYVN